MRIWRILGTALLLGLLVAGAVGYPAQTSAAESCFQETGFCIQGRFLDYWTANDGLARNGYPLGPERHEVLEDGNEYTVQYFERVRLESHPENPAPYDVLLGQFGRRVLAEEYVVRRSAYAGSVAPAEPLAGQVYFAQTGHNLGGRFLDYWTANGGLAQFGFPITEERFDTLEDRLVYRTQYFERARFEYHPENEGTPYAVLLGQFGRRIQTENAQLGDKFGWLYLSDTTLQVR